MPFYNIYSDSVKQSGTYSLTEALPKEVKPYIDKIISPFLLETPLSLLFTRIEPGSENPFRYVLLSSDFAMYFAVKQEEVSEILNSYVSPYQHNNYEFMYILDGACCQTVDGRQLVCRKGDCYFQKPYVMRCEDYSTEYFVLTIILSPDYIQNILFNSLMYRDYTIFSLRPKYRNPIYASEIRFVLENITRLFLDSQAAGKNDLIRGYLCRIFHLLNSNSRFDIVSLKKEKNTALFDRIASLMQMTHGRISRHQLENQLNYSGVYLNMIVKKYTNMTISQYRNMFAMQRASYLLLNTTKTISEICIELQFSDRTYFYKIFKERYGVTPKEYRKKKGGR